MQQNHKKMDLDELRNRHQWQEIIQNQSLHNIWVLEAHIELDSLTPEHNSEFLQKAYDSFKKEHDMVQDIDVELIYVKALLKFGKIQEAMRHFQRIDLNNFPMGSRGVTLIAELLFAQVNHFKSKILCDFSEGSAAWDFVYQVIKELYSQACLLLDHVLNRGDVLRDSTLKRELKQFINDREERFGIIPLDEVKMQFMFEGQNDNRGQHEIDNGEQENVHLIAEEQAEQELQGNVQIEFENGEMVVQGFGHGNIVDVIDPFLLEIEEEQEIVQLIAEAQAEQGLEGNGEQENVHLIAEEQAEQELQGNVQIEFENGEQGHGNIVDVIDLFLLEIEEEQEIVQLIAEAQAEQGLEGNGEQGFGHGNIVDVIDPILLAGHGGFQNGFGEDNVGPGLLQIEIQHGNQNESFGIEQNLPPNTMGNDAPGLNEQNVPAAGYEQTFSSIENDVKDLKLKLLDGFIFSLNENLTISQTRWDDIITNISGLTGSVFPGRLGQVLIKNYGDMESAICISEFNLIEIIKKMLMIDGNEDSDVFSLSSLSSHHSEHPDD